METSYFLTLTDPKNQTYKQLGLLLKKIFGEMSFRHPYFLAKQIYDMIPDTYDEEKLSIARVVLDHDKKLTRDSKTIRDVMFGGPEKVDELMLCVYGSLAQMLESIDEKCTLKSGFPPMWLRQIKDYFNGKK